MCLLRSLSLIWRSDTHALSSPHCAHNQANAKNISNYLRALPAAANARGVASYSTRPTFWGQHPVSYSCEGAQLTQKFTQRRSGGRYLSLIREQTGSRCANLWHHEAAETGWSAWGRETAHRTYRNQMTLVVVVWSGRGRHQGLLADWRIGLISASHW